MAELLDAVADSLIGHIYSDDVETIETILSTVDDDVMWRDVMTYELNLEPLMEGRLECDIVLPRLAIFDICTITPLHYAALRGADTVVDMFIKAGKLPVDSMLRSGTTALQLACFTGMIDIATLLIDQYQAKINLKDKYGWTALHYASLGGEKETIEFLISRNVDVSARDKDGTTAAFRAQAYGRDDIVSVLLSATGDDDQLLVDDCPGDSAPIYSSIKRVADPSPDSQGESPYSVPVIPPRGYQEEEEENEYLTAAEVERAVSINNSQLDVNKDEPVGIPPAEIKKEINDPDYATLDMGYDTMTNILRDEFLKFRSQKLSSQKRKPRPSILGSDSFSSDHSRHVHSVNKDYEDVGAYAELMKIQNTCRVMDQQEFSQTLPPTSNNSKFSHQYLSAPTLPSRPAFLVPPPFPPPRNQEKIGFNYTDTIDKSRLILILKKIEHDSAMMEASFVALADQLRAPDDWKVLAFALPLRSNPSRIEKKITQIEKKFPGDVRRQTLELLRQWRNHRGDGATVQSLCTAMSNCGLRRHTKQVEAASQEFSA